MRVRARVKALLDAARRFLDRRSTAWALGVFLPPVMLFLDPIVFRGSSAFGPALLGRYRALGYVSIALGVVALVLALVSDRAKAPVAGFLAAASTFGFVLGMVILPVALLGILALGLGLLGLSPFASALVFARWSRKVFRASASKYRGREAIAGFLVFVIATAGMQIGASQVLKSALGHILAGNGPEAATATDRLRHWRTLVDMDRFIAVWAQQSDPECKQRLADAYRSVTGDDVEQQASRFAD